LYAETKPLVSEMSAFYPDEWESLSREELTRCRARVTAFVEKVSVKGVREQMEALVPPLEEVQEAILGLVKTHRE